MQAGASGRTRRVVVAETSLPVRQELCELLGLMDGVEVVGRAADGAEAVYLAAALNPDVVILDLKMARMDGFRAATLIRDQIPGCLLVALTVHELESEHERARRAGFDLFLAMDAPPSTLLDVISRALTQPAPSSHRPRERPGSPVNPQQGQVSCEKRRVQ